LSKSAASNKERKTDYYPERDPPQAREESYHDVRRDIARNSTRRNIENLENNESRYASTQRELNDPNFDPDSFSRSRTTRRGRNRDEVNVLATPAQRISGKNRDRIENTQTPTVNA
jgi:hypothetical protein